MQTNSVKTNWDLITCITNKNGHSFNVSDDKTLYNCARLGLYMRLYIYHIIIYIRLEVTSRWRPFGPLDFIFCALWCIIWVGGGEDERLECQWLVVDISFHKMYDWDVTDAGQWTTTSGQGSSSVKGWVSQKIHHPTCFTAVFTEDKLIPILLVIVFTTSDRSLFSRSHCWNQLLADVG